MGIKIYCDFCEEEPELDLFEHKIYDLTEDTLEPFGWARIVSPYSTSVMFFYGKKCNDLRLSLEKMPTKFFEKHANKTIIKHPIARPKMEDTRPSMEVLDAYKVYTCRVCINISLRAKAIGTHESDAHKDKNLATIRFVDRPTKYVTEKVYNKLVRNFESRAGRKYDPEVDNKS